MDIIFKNTHKTLEDFDSERGLLACCGVNTEVLHEAMDEVRTEWFAKPLHREIWEKLVEYSDKGDCLDVLVEMDMESEVQPDVREVFQSVETSGQWRHFFSKAKDAFKYREVRKYVYGLVDMVNQQVPIEEVLNEADRGATKLLQTDTSAIRTGREICESTVDRIKERQQTGYITGIKTGIRNLDNLTLGFTSGQLVVVAARPGMGKTAFAVEVSNSALRQQNRVYFVSLEMEGEEVMQRMQVNYSGVPIKPIEDKTASPEEVSKFKEACKFYRKERLNETLWIDDDAGLCFAQIRSRARKLARRGIDMIVVDYAQIVSSDPGREKESDYVRVSYISRSMKILAKELKCPVILLAQLSRKAEDHEKPKLSDMKESGGLEQDADIVMALWRKDSDKDDPTKREISVIKQRNGRTDTVSLEFKPAIQRMSQRSSLA
tara:strand:- start:2216 stop:3517 length:1302 start_codon:yes stop_codon:yes gene_type:complete